MRALESIAEILRFAVLQRHFETAQRAPGGNIATHRAGADDVHVARAEGLFVTETLEALLQEKHPDQVAHLVALDQARDRVGFFVHHALARAVVIRPDVEDRVGGRVVLARRFFCDLFLHVGR